MEGDDDPHARYIPVFTHGDVLAVCSCGWRSPAFSRGGLAGAAWDRHRADEMPTAAEVPATNPANEDRVVDLMAALEQSVKDARACRGTDDPGT